MSPPVYYTSLYRYIRHDEPALGVIGVRAVHRVHSHICIDIEQYDIMNIQTKCFESSKRNPVFQASRYAVPKLSKSLVRSGISKQGLFFRRDTSALILNAPKRKQQKASYHIVKS